MVSRQSSSSTKKGNKKSGQQARRPSQSSLSVESLGGGGGGGGYEQNDMMRQMLALQEKMVDLQKKILPLQRTTSSQQVQMTMAETGASLEEVVQDEELRDEVIMNMELSYDEKKDLKDSIEKLPPAKLNKVIEIIQKRMELSGLQGDEEVELDMDQLDTPTLRQLQKYVQTCKPKKAPQKPPARQPPAKGKGTKKSNQTASRNNGKRNRSPPPAAAASRPAAAPSAAIAPAPFASASASAPPARGPGSDSGSPQKKKKKVEVRMPTRSTYFFWPTFAITSLLLLCTAYPQTSTCAADRCSAAGSPSLDGERQLAWWRIVFRRRFR